MKRFFLLYCVVMLSFTLSAQENNSHGLRLGINKMQPNFLNYSPDIGFHLGILSEKAISESFGFVKEIYLSRTSFDYHKPSTVLNLENTTYSLGIPVSIKWKKLKWVRPYVGIALKYNFQSTTEYYISNTDEVNVQDLELAVLAGIEIPFVDRVALDFRFMGTPVLGDNLSTTYAGWQFSINYNLPSK